MTIEIYILFILICTAFAFGVIACIGWNKESLKFEKLKQDAEQLEQLVSVLEFELAKANVTKDIQVINEGVELHA